MWFNVDLFNPKRRLRRIGLEAANQLLCMIIGHHKVDGSVTFFGIFLQGNCFPRLFEVNSAE